MAIKVWSAGETLTATDLNNNFAQKQDTVFDTGWINITAFEAGSTAQTGVNTPQVRRFGPVVMLRGRITTSVTGNVTFATLPDGYGLIPTGIWELGHGTASGSATSRFYVTNTGTLSAQSWAATTVAISGTYGVD